MSITYNYKTGKIAFDFKLKKCDSVCKRHDRRAHVKIGNDVCMRCHSYVGERSGFVMCKYHVADDEGAKEVYWKLRKELEYEALCALCH